jgi:SAM-dependent methyltransferase
LKDSGLRIGFVSDGGGTLDYGRRLSRLRWRHRFPGRPWDALEPETDATRALSASEGWVIVAEETALPTPGSSVESVAGRVVLAASLSPASAPFVHTLRELEATPRPEEGEPGRGIPPSGPALAFSVADFPPHVGETVGDFVRRLLSPPTPHALVPGFAAVAFEERPGERPEIVRLLPATVRRLLDVGCGSGEVGGAVRRTVEGATVTGIERDPAAAERARGRLDRVIEGDAVAALRDLTRAGERFDALLFADVLEHLEDPIGALVLAREIATPDATLVASVPNVGHLSLVRDLVLGRFDPIPAGLADAGHVRWFTRASLGDALEEAGWRVASIDSVGGAPPPDPQAFLDFVSDWPEGDRESLGTYQWLAVARSR